MAKSNISFARPWGLNVGSVPLERFGVVALVQGNLSKQMRMRMRCMSAAAFALW